MKITKEELAARLNGREYGNEITKEEEKLAKNSGLVVVFGYSDDNVEFRGAINDEVGCYGEKIVKVCRDGLLGDWDDVKDDEDMAARYLENKKSSKSIKAIWCKEKDYCWAYSTSIPHVAFDIVEDEGERITKFCRGLVFSIDDLG